MIKIYYTTAVGQDEIQDKIQLSLGGYKSSTPFKSGELNNLFGEITDYTITVADQDQYIGLVVKNESSSVVENINLWFIYPVSGCYSKFYVSAVDLSTDTNGVKYMESITNINSKPVYSEFVEADGTDNKQDLGYLEAGGMFGLWIKRELIEVNIAADKVNLVQTDPNNSDKAVQIPVSQSDLIQMYMSYDELGISIAGYYVINDRIKGDTSPAILFTVDIDGTAVDLTDCNILSQFRLSRTSPVAMELETGGSGITITDATGGEFKIDEIDTLLLDAGTYYYDIQITFPDNTVKTWIEGTMTVLNHVTE